MNNTSALKVSFQQNGGFNRNGCFVEDDKDEEYEKVSFMSPEIVSPELTFVRGWNKVERYENSEITFNEEQSEYFRGKATIAPSRSGQYMFSIFGSKGTHETVEVHIRKSDQISCAIIPVKENADIDFSSEERFIVQITLAAASFEDFRSEYFSRKQRLVISLRLGGMEGVYTTWSPSISEGRVIKFLDERDDISNVADTPSSFCSVSPSKGLDEFSMSLVTINSNKAFEK